MSVKGVGFISPVLQFVDADGVPYAGGSITFYAAATSNLQTVYSDAALTTPLTNPVSLNAAGRTSTSTSGPDTGVYFSALPYDATLKNAIGTTIWGPQTFGGSDWPGAIQSITTLAPAVNANGYANEINPTIAKAASGTHALFAGTYFDAPTISAGSATLTASATVYIAGAPTAGTAPYAIYVAAGAVNFEGAVTRSGSPIGCRVSSVTSSTTPTPNADTTDLYDITALAAAATVGAPTGTPVNAQKLIIRIKDNGTARGLTWNASYVAGGVALPATTVLSKIVTIGFIYNTANALNKWQCVAVSQEA